jgi:SAM-dependent methyltransferase
LLTTIKNEKHVYNTIQVSSLTGETLSYDATFFFNVIRKRELELIKQLLRSEQPKFILDYGCGGGWLSKFLLRWDFKFVGVDVSKKMVKTAKIVCHEADFIVCDAMKLPFRDGVFDFIIGVAILHHLDLRPSIDELKRVSFSQSTFLFMEPNLLNPLSALGRKLFPMEAHTEGEKPYIPKYLESALSLGGLSVERFFTMFFAAFTIARFLKIMRLDTRTPHSLVKLVYFFEVVMERIPGIRCLNSNIITVARARN